MSKHTLYDNIWERHKILTLPSGKDLLFIGLHYVHEVTSPQAFEAVREKGAKLAYPNRTFASMDHVNPTDNLIRPFQDPLAETMAAALEKNVQEFGVRYFSPQSGYQGVMHIIGPELGLTRPGMTIVCGDSHTATHGAVGSIAFGIGTTEVQTVLETQSLALNKLNVRCVLFTGTLGKSVFAKDLALYMIQQLGVKGGVGFAYEYAGPVIESLCMEERLTLCNMSIEGGARVGYINPDQITYDWIKGRLLAPKNDDWNRSVAYWQSIVSKQNAVYDDSVTLDVTHLEPMVTWGINPQQCMGISQQLPNISDFSDPELQRSAQAAYDYMKLKPGTLIAGTPVDVVFIGSCTNGRITDFRQAAEILRGKKVKVRTLIVPGSQVTKKQAEAEGLDAVFIAAGAEWREPGCSMCLAMNPDKLIGDQLCVATSNRNFMGRQGSPTGRTVLASAAMAAAAAVTGKICDVRQL